MPAGKRPKSECAQTIFDTNTAQQLHSTKKPFNYTHIYTGAKARAWRIADTSQPGMLGKAGNQTSVFCHDNNTKAKASLMRQFLLITKANAAGIAAIAQHTESSHIFYSKYIAFQRHSWYTNIYQHTQSLHGVEKSK